MSRSYKGCFAWVSGLLIAGIMVGCTPCKPGQAGPTGRYNIEVTLVDALLTNSIIVDLVGVNQSGLPGLKSYDMDKYWDPQGDQKRRDSNPRMLNFVSGDSSTKKLSIRDPIWDEWKSKGVRYVFVLADLDLPSQAKGQVGEDPRRMVLALDQCNWPAKTTTLKVLVRPTLIEVLTADRAAK